MNEQIRIFEVVKGSKDINPVIVERVTQTHIYKKNYHNHEIVKYKRKGNYRRYYDTKESAVRAARKGW